MLSPQLQLPEPTVLPVPSHPWPWLQGHPTLPVLFRSGCFFLISLATLHSAFLDISPPSWQPPPSVRWLLVTSHVRSFGGWQYGGADPHTRVPPRTPLPIAQP